MLRPRVVQLHFVLRELHRELDPSNTPPRLIRCLLNVYDILNPRLWMSRKSVGFGAKIKAWGCDDEQLTPKWTLRAVTCVPWNEGVCHLLHNRLTANCVHAAGV